MIVQGNKNMNPMYACLYPVIHVQDVNFIHNLVFLFSSKEYSMREINLCERKHLTRRGSGTSGLRGTPSTCK